MMSSEYTPVDPDFFDIIEKEQLRKEHSTVHFFGDNNEICDARGSIRGVSTDTFEKYLFIDADKKVRVDRIITINGKPGPAYDEYDRYALACLDCRARTD